MFERVPIEGKCPRCDGPMVLETWDSDCNYNPGGSSEECKGLCYMFFDYDMKGYRPKTDSSKWGDAERKAGGGI
jgi:hypothetical protein